MGAQVEGLDRLRTKLGLLTTEGKKTARIEVKRAALNVETGAKGRAPVDTGRLRNSITHEERKEGLAAVIGTNVTYAPHQEFGTRFHRAKPYLFPAFEEERPRFVASLRRALDETNKRVSR